MIHERQLRIVESQWKMLWRAGRGFWLEAPGFRNWGRISINRQCWLI